MNERKLDMKKIAQKKSIIVSTKEAIRNVTPMKWSTDVLSGQIKVVVANTRYR